MEILIAFHKEINNKSNFTTRAIQRLIQLRTRSKYYHVEFVYKGLWYSMDNEGLTIQKLRPLKDKYDYITIVKHVSEEQEALIESFINTKIKYDWLGILFSQLISIGGNDTHKYFCSEFVAKILQIMLAEEIVFQESNKIDPGDLYELLTKYKD